MNDFALEHFWRQLDRFVKVMIGWANDFDPPSILEAMAGPDRHVTITSAGGVAAEVWHAVRDIDHRDLDLGEAALFLAAARQVDRLCKQHGFDGSGDTPSWDVPPDCDGGHFRAIAGMVAGRMAQPFAAPTTGAGSGMIAGPPRPNPIRILAARKSPSPVKVRFLMFMEDRERATFDEVAGAVHKDELASAEAIQQNVYRVNEYLDEIDPGGLVYRFSTASEHVFKVPSAR